MSRDWPVASRAMWPHRAPVLTDAPEKGVSQVIATQIPMSREGPSDIRAQARHLVRQVKLAVLLAEFGEPALAPGAYRRLSEAARAKYHRQAECILGWLTEENRRDH